MKNLNIKSKIIQIQSLQNRLKKSYPLFQSSMSKTDKIYFNKFYDFNIVKKSNRQKLERAIWRRERPQTMSHASRNGSNPLFKVLKNERSITGSKNIKFHHGNARTHINENVPRRGEICHDAPCPLFASSDPCGSWLSTILRTVQTLEKTRKS